MRSGVMSRNLEQIEAREHRVRWHATRGLAGFLASLPWVTPRPWAALIGSWQPIEVLALARGVRARLRRESADPLYGLTWFCWGERRDETFRFLRHHNEPGRRCRIGAIVRACPNKTLRMGWRHRVNYMVTTHQEPFGIICHCGIGAEQDIRGDLEAVLPMADDQTLLVVLRANLPETDGAVKKLLRDGWSAVHIGLILDMALLQKAGRAKPNEEAQNA